jgi:hypothetical protein
MVLDGGVHDVMAVRKVHEVSGMECMRYLAWHEVHVVSSDGE